MTDRLKALTVVLEQDIRTDDAEALINAIAHLRGVADVRGEVATVDTHVAAVRARTEMRTRIFKALEEL